MNKQDKENMQKVLLEITKFREVLYQYYRVTDLISWRHWLDMPLPPYGMASCDVGKHELNISALRKSLSVLEGSTLPEPAVRHLYNLICVSIKNSSLTDFFQLMEPESTNKKIAPPSIKQLAANLDLPESREIIEKLTANTEKIFTSLKDKIDKLWEKHGKSAYVFRNPMIHGRIDLTDPNSQAWNDLTGNEQSSRDFYKTLDGIYDILNFVSKSFFGEKKDLPNYREYQESIFDGTPGGSVWCFNTNKFPTNINSSHFPINVLSPE